MANPNFLILDEPTNDLDIVTLNVLEDYLLDFPGTVLIVSHDRFFMDKIVDHLFILEGAGKVKDYNGTYSKYREYQKEQQHATPTVVKEKKVEEKPKEEVSYEDRKQYNRLLKEVEKLENKKEEITNQFSDLSLDQEKIKDLSIELAQVKEDLEDKEMEWMELAEKLGI